MSFAARAFIGTVIAAGTCVLAYGLFHWSSQAPVKFACYLLAALVSSRLKVKLPGITGTMSVNFLFILLSVLELGLAETMVLGCAAVLAQCFSRYRPQAVHICFNVCGTAVAVAAAYSTYHFATLHWQISNHSLLLVAAASTYFVANTLPIAAAISLTEGKSLKKVWSECYFWSFPYYLAGAGVAGLVSWLNHVIDWQTSLLVLPVVYMIYRSYRLYLGKLEEEKNHVEDQKRHVEEMASLHLRTIEALALAIEAKDHTTHEHLQRVRVYAVEIAKELNVGAEELEALNAAALLHDIGKLAVPEHIISKPSRLTPEEFEKMKIHPIVGAEILERVSFPYPVVPIVRAHHERWDGTGYPYGIRGEEIPIGARILSAVDFVDALASNRQYRLALPLEEVVVRLRAESGKSFDPRVVEVLAARYPDLEKLVSTRSGQIAWTKLSTDLKVERGAAPATGFAETAGRKRNETTFLASIAAARQEAQTLFELSQELGISLSLSETLSVFSVKLKALFPYDAVAIYVCRNGELVPEHVSGDNFRVFASLRIPIGEGISGWVAQNKKPIINGNPAVEPGYPNDSSKISDLNSALAVPLEGSDAVVGVLTLYSADKDAFTSDHLRILLAISSKMAMAIENALKYQQAESSATTDYLTGLPNARSLFLQLDRELARCKRDDSSLTVMVSDMDGFKQVNDRFGHLEGNRVLRMFAHLLKQSCREYDYAARMGGDEFVLIVPGLTPEAADKKAEHVRDLMRQVGQEIGNENILSLSVGQAVYPRDGRDAEELLAEADRRMYSEKKKQPDRKNRRAHPRLRCSVLRPCGSDPPVWGSVTNISLGGCYIETTASAMLDAEMTLIVSAGENRLGAEGAVIRTDPGVGIAIRFKETSRESRAQVQRILEYVEATNKLSASTQGAGQLARGKGMG
jgi:diguanylate cyclase (GGDEF)-like protein/putative nucleotidyltransferase with HDIG domain